MRRLVVEALRRDGYDVLEAPDGGRALVAITAQYADASAELDLFISDIRMPVCSGLELVESMDRTCRRIPVILMTSFGDDDARARAKLLGVVLLDKPFPLGVMRSAVRALLARAQSTTS